MSLHLNAVVCDSSHSEQYCFFSSFVNVTLAYTDILSILTKDLSKGHTTKTRMIDWTENYHKPLRRSVI